MITDLLRRGRTAIELADVTIAAPSRTFDFTFARRRRFLRWTWTRLVRRRFVVSALPMRELLVMHARIRELSAERDGLGLWEICVVILGTLDALNFTEPQATAIWDWYQEANQLARPKAGPAETPAATAAAPSSISSSISSELRSDLRSSGSST